ncbi:YhcH/YjgK/YiaL family protein [Azospirillum sp. RWY-5-1]|uniref:YhcH/YjgK/YiaL family protein n=1 Tax=Azospirillum oleiclasticum TaxID=2735135 RepID=A0ABX2TDM0_9PROT|nr:YhcH/YjgK/YiaL family protein [Azospirillum oleiclasticum]NYZ13886.1 YhcH/YjgK/YiaL family protein [Azospirillum oleiclasticum]NYZ20810.1 YhcH/YjgK/YiaL family protein [Azospirillum oleiclasticum]
MLFGNVHTLQDMAGWLPEPIRIAVEHLRDTDFLAMPVGNYELRGQDIVVQVFDVTTRVIEQTRPEVHRKHIDVQFLCRGHERIGVAVDTGNNKVAEDLLEQRDLLFYEAMEDESTLTMRPGNFAVFFPTDVHRPACVDGEPERVRKVVIKIRTALLAAHPPS